MNAFDIRPLLSLHFWFDGTPPPLLPFFEKTFFVFFALTLVGAILLGVLEQRRKGRGLASVALQKVRRLLTTLGILGFVLLFFAYERAPYLSARYLVGFLFVGCGVWGVLVARWWVRDVPKLRQAAGEQKSFQKYLPR